MKNFEDYQNSSWIERIRKYEDLKDQKEYWQNECERKDDNIIRQVNEINTKLDTLLFAVNTIMHSQTKENKANSKKKTKNDKSITEDKKVENKANKGVKNRNKKD